MLERNKIYCGNSVEILKTFPDECISMCVTSPPYYKLREYFVDNQIGQESTPELYVEHLVEVFREVRRVLRNDGQFWLNLGDSHAGSGVHAAHHKNPGISNAAHRGGAVATPIPQGMKPTDLMEIPSMVAIALRNDGWYLRCRLPWVKRNCLGSETILYVKSQKGVMPMTTHDLIRLDPKTIELWNGEKWTKCVDFHRTEEEIDDAIKLELRSGEIITCTKEHRWSTTRGLLPTSELKIGDILTKTTLPDTNHLGFDYIPDKFGRIIGLFLAEGSYLTKNEKAGIVFTLSEKETHLDEEIRQFALDYGGSHHSHTYDTGGKLMSVIHGQVPIAIIRTYIINKGSKEKRLSNACWLRSNTFLRNLLDGYLEGDGHNDIKNNRWRLGFCRNDNLAKDMRVLCARLGISLRLKRGNCTAVKGGKPHSIWRGQIRFDQDNRSVNGTCFKHKEDTEIVAIKKAKTSHFYDIGVEDEPHLFALASGVLTHNSMPDSAKIRPGHAVEYVFQFAKSGDSYFDHESIRVAHTKANQEDYDARVRRGMLGWGDQSTAKHSVDAESGIQHYAKSKKGRSRDEFHHPGGRQRRDSDSFFESWQGLYEEDGDLLGLVVNPKGNKYTHFATFPEGLIEPLIKCSTSAFGYCRECGAPFKRVIKKGEPDEEWKAECGADSKGGYQGVSEKWLKQDELGKNTYTGFNARWKKTQQNASDVKRRVLEGMAGSTTLGWIPTCDCQIIEGPEKYSHKQTGVNIGQSPSSFVRETKIEKERELHKKQAKERYPDDEKAQKAYIKYMHDHGQIAETNTIGWAPTCNCHIIRTLNKYPFYVADDYSYRRDVQKSILDTYAQYKPARGIVLDPFLGSGTSAVVAKRLGLDYIGIDLNADYIKIAEKRISESNNPKPEKKGRKSNKKQVTLDAGT